MASIMYEVRFCTSYFDGSTGVTRCNQRTEELDYPINEKEARVQAGKVKGYQPSHRCRYCGNTHMLVRITSATEILQTKLGEGA